MQRACIIVEGMHRSAPRIIIRVRHHPSKIISAPAAGLPRPGSSIATARDTDLVKPDVAATKLIEPHQPRPSTGTMQMRVGLPMARGRSADRPDCRAAISSITTYSSATKSTLLSLPWRRHPWRLFSRWLPEPFPLPGSRRPSAVSDRSRLPEASSSAGSCDIASRFQSHRQQNHRADIPYACAPLAPPGCTTRLRVRLLCTATFFREA